MRGVLLASLFLISLFCRGISAEPVNRELLARLKTEGCASLKKLEKEYSHIHLKWVMRAKDGRVYEYDYHGQGDKFRLKRERTPEYEFRNKDNKSHPTYFIKNRDYYFVIAKDTEEDAWIVYDSQDADTFAPEEEEDVEDVSFLLPVYLYTDSLADLILNPGFEITAIDSLPDQPEETVCLEFANTGKVFRGNRGEELKTGSIRLLPARGWMIQEAMLHFNHPDGKPYGNRIVFTYDDDQNKTFPLKHSQCRLITNNFEFTWDHDVLGADRAKLPDEMFYTTYYGFPEPDFGESHSGCLRPALALLGALMIAGALLATFKSRKQRNASKEIPG